MQQLRWKIAQFFENFWWKNYLKGKTPQEYLTWKSNYWNHFLFDVGTTQSHLLHPIIDIGCGPAGIFTILNQKEVTALDPLLEEYEKLAIFNKSDYPTVDFVQSSFEDFKSPKKYQTIFCLNAINHFIDIGVSFKKLNEICENKGQLFLSIDAHNHSFFKKLFSLLPFDILHPHQYDLAEYQSFLNENGFEIGKTKLVKKEFFFSYYLLVANKK